MRFKHGLKFNSKMTRFGICPGKNRANVASSVVFDGWRVPGIVSPLWGTVFRTQYFAIDRLPFRVGVNADVFQWEVIFYYLILMQLPVILVYQAHTTPSQ